MKYRHLRTMTTVPLELWPIVYHLATAEAWPPQDDASVIAFFEFANRQSLLSLLMTDTTVPVIVAKAKSRFRVLEALHRRRNELTRDAAREFQRTVGDSTFLFFKGSDYRHRLYSQPDLRPMADIDVLVPSQDLANILGCLVAAGYSPTYAGHGACFAPSYHEITVVVQNVGIDIHRSYGQDFRAGIDYDSILQRREKFYKDGVFGHRMSPADAILSHAYSGLAMDEFTPPLIRYVDFYLLLQYYEHALDECVSRAKSWNIERPFFSALHITSTLFPSIRTAAVTDAIEQLLDRQTRHFLVKRVLPDPATEPSGHGSGRRRQLWRKFLLIDHAWRRVAFIVYYIYETLIGYAFEWCQRRKRLPPA
jgi:Uncharacterised nucleotidyltransferase